MKRNIHVLTLVLFVLLFQACKKQDAPNETGTPQNTKSEALLEKLKSLGFPEKLIVDNGRSFVVDGDLYFDKEHTDLKQLEQFFGPKKKDIQVYGRTPDFDQAHTNNLVGSGDVETITFRIITPDQPNGVSYEWYDAIEQAANHWNAISNTKINIYNYGQYNFNQGSADIVFASSTIDPWDPLPFNVIAAADFPAGTGKPGLRVRINLAFNNGNVPISQKVYNMVHEIGHTLGLRHTNWVNDYPSNIGANHIPGTPASDPNSVMNGGTANYSWNGFSSYDIIAAQYLYPWSNPMDKWITSPDAKSPNNVVNLLEDDYNLTVNWNTALHVTSSVTLRIYQNNTLVGTLGSGLPNTGSATFSRSAVLQAINWQYRYTERNLRIELISDTNPSVRDMTGYFNILVSS